MAYSSSRRTSTRPPSRSTTSAASCRSSWSERSSSRSTSRRSRTRRRSCSGSAVVASPRCVALLPAAAPGARTRSTTWTSPARRVFWVAACAGIIVFGSLMGAAFISQQFLQNVLGYSTLEAGRVDPARGADDGDRRAALGEARGGPRRPVHAALGYVFLVLAFLSMLLLWKEDTAYWKVALALRPHRHRRRLRRHARVALAYRLRSRRAGRMASGTADLQRDLGGAIMQSIFGALLTAGYAAAVGAAIAASPDKSRSPTARRPSSRSRSRAPRTSPSSIRSTPTQISPARRRRSSRATSGPIPPASSR